MPKAKGVREAAVTKGNGGELGRGGDGSVQHLIVVMVTHMCVGLKTQNCARKQQNKLQTHTPYTDDGGDCMVEYICQNSVSA